MGVARAEASWPASRHARTLLCRPSNQARMRLLGACPAGRRSKLGTPGPGLTPSINIPFINACPHTRLPAPHPLFSQWAQPVLFPLGLVPLSEGAPSLSRPLQPASPVFAGGRLQQQQHAAGRASFDDGGEARERQGSLRTSSSRRSSQDPGSARAANRLGSLAHSSARTSHDSRGSSVSLHGSQREHAGSRRSAEAGSR